jgi:hypothetical protein
MAEAAGGLQGKVQGLGHVVAGHAGAQLPGNNVAGEVVQYRLCDVSPYGTT